MPSSRSGDIGDRRARNDSVISIIEPKIRQIHLVDDMIYARISSMITR